MAGLWSLLASAAALWIGSVEADVFPFTNAADFTALADQTNGFPNQRFRSSDIVAPIFQVNIWDPSLVDDSPYIFIGSVYGHMRAGPMILDARDLSLIYADQRYENAYTSEVQMINGSRHLTFWEGYHSRGHANGFCLVYDEDYNLKYNVSAVGLHGALADMHEMQVTENATVIFSTYWNIPYDVSPIGGPPDGLLMDSGFQEVDAATNELLFSWAASDHFAITESFARYSEGFGVGPDSGFDFFHINSIQKTAEGNYLISSRHLSLLALIDGKEGHPIWILGGRRNQFKDLSGGIATNFAWQHDARFAGNESHITLFDNHGEHTGACPPGRCVSRGLHLEIDTESMTARTVAEYFHPESVDAGAMGGFQPLPNGNVMVAWGHSPGFVEYTSDGRPVMDVQRGKLGVESQNDMFAYRVNKGQWQGRPKWPPSVAMDSPAGTTENATVYVSWNGATDVAQWAIFTTDNPLEISDYKSLLLTTNRTGFETIIPLGPNTTTRYLAAAALHPNGSVLGSSLIFDMANGQPVVMHSNIASIQPSVKAFGPAGLLGGGVIAMVAAVSACVWFGRRKNRKGDVEKAQYKPVLAVE